MASTSSYGNKTGLIRFFVDPPSDRERKKDKPVIREKPCLHYHLTRSVKAGRENIEKSDRGEKSDRLAISSRWPEMMKNVTRSLSRFCQFIFSFPPLDPFPVQSRGKKEETNTEEKVKKNFQSEIWPSKRMIQLGRKLKVEKKLFTNLRLVGRF